MINCISTMDKFRGYKTIQFHIVYYVGKNQGILTMLIFLEKSINLEDEIMKLNETIENIELTEKMIKELV